MDVGAGDLGGVLDGVSDIAVFQLEHGADDAVGGIVADFRHAVTDGEASPFVCRLGHVAFLPLLALFLVFSGFFMRFLLFT